MVLAYWCMFSNDDTGAWVRYDRIVPYHPDIIHAIRLSNAAEFYGDQRKALMAARDAYMAIPPSSRKTKPTRLPVDFSSKIKHSPDSADMLLSDDAADTGVADEASSAHPRQIEDGSRAQDDDMEDDESDKESDDEGNGLGKTSHSNDRMSKGHTGETNGDSKRKDKRTDDQFGTGDTSTKNTLRRRGSDSGDEYSADGGDDDGGDDPMNLGSPSSEEDEPPPPPPLSTQKPKQKRETTGRGGRGGRGRGGGRRSTGAGVKRKLSTSNAATATTGPGNTPTTPATTSTPSAKRARSGTNSNRDKSDVVDLNLGRGARRREQQREMEELRAENTTAHETITELQETVQKQAARIAEMENDVRLVAPLPPGNITLKRPSPEEYRSTPVTTAEFDGIMKDLISTFEIFKSNVKDAQLSREGLTKYAMNVLAEYDKRSKDVTMKEKKAVGLETELLRMLANIITLDVDIKDMKAHSAGMWASA